VAENGNPGALAGATGAVCRHAIATGTAHLAQPTRIRQQGTLYCITPSDGDPFRIAVAGRNKWALDRLRKAGREGCTPISDPAPRWSAYIHNLRRLGVEIETIHEAHAGDFPGHHARYVLRSAVSGISERGQA
jgi:hypothetical protein